MSVSTIFSNFPLPPSSLFHTPYADDDDDDDDDNNNNNNNYYYYYYYTICISPVTGISSWYFS